jgi:hypothetical protein
MLLDRLPPLDHQHPQCNGKNKDRILFGKAVGHPTIFKLSRHGQTYGVEAGETHGVVTGTLFAIHGPSIIKTIVPEIGILEADSVFHDACTLRRPSEDIEFEIPPGAKASVLNWKQGANALKVFIDPSRDEIQSVGQAFSLVDSSLNADLVIRRTDDNTLQFKRLDPLMSKYMQMLNDIRPTTLLLDILQGVSHFNHHLSRRNSANPLKQYVKVELNSLTQSNPDMASAEAIYMPDGKISMTLAPDHENTVFISNEATTYYGLTVTNESGRNLFPYLIYFDPSDYSVEVRCL